MQIKPELKQDVIKFHLYIRKKNVISTFPECFLFFPSGKPDSPSRPTVSDTSANQMRVSWKPPDCDGGSPITGYLVEYKQDSSPEWVKCNLADNSTNVSILVNGLHEKTKYQFRVSAENQFGLGSSSKPSTLYKTLGR